MRRLHTVLAAVGILCLAATGCSSAGFDVEASASPARRDVPPTERESFLILDETFGTWVATQWAVVNYVHAWDVANGARYVAAAEAAEAQAVAAQRVSVPRSAPRPSAGGGRNDGCYASQLPPHIVDRESGGNPVAQNPTSTASGCFQFLDSTWAGAGGYRRAADAPVELQVQRANELWNGGRGCSHWSAC